MQISMQISLVNLKIQPGKRVLCGEDPKAFGKHALPGPCQPRPVVVIHEYPRGGDAGSQGHRAGT